MAPMANDEQPPRPLFGRHLAAVLALGAGLRLFLLGDKGFWIDEIYRLCWAKGQEVWWFFDVRPSDIGPTLPALDLGRVFQLARLHNPPINAFLLNLWIRSVGAESDFAVRLPIAIAGAAAVAGIYLWAREVFDERVALFAALAAAASPQLIHLSQETNHYALPLALQAFATWLFFRMLRTRDRRDEIGFFLLSLLAIFSHYYCVIVLGAQALALWVHWRREPRQALATTWTAAVPAGALGLYLAFNRKQLAEITDASLMGNHPPLPYFAQRSYENLLEPWTGEKSLPLAGVLVLLALIFALVVRGSKGREDERRRLVLIVALLPYCTTTAAFWILRTNSLLWPRYHSFFAPPFFVLAAAGALSLQKRPARLAVALALVTALGIGLHHYYAEYRMEDWRGAARVIDTHASAQDAVVILPVNTTYAIARYLKRDLPLFGADAEPGYYAKLLASTRRRPAVWTVFAWNDDGPLARRLRGELGCSYPLREDYVLDRMHISRYHGGERIEGTLDNGCPRP
jgi:hypothetical protein